MAWDKYKQSLLEEKSKLESELSLIATKNPQHPGEWEVKAPDLNPMVSDQSELADMFEELETQTGLEAQLEERLKHVLGALKRIEENNYGKCSACGKNIEEKRLDANPFAETCIEHME